MQVVPLGTARWSGANRPIPVLQPHALAPQPPQVMARGAGNVLALQIKTNVRDLIGKTLV